jgi:hypothetical protein
METMAKIVSQPLSGCCLQVVHFAIVLGFDEAQDKSTLFGHFGLLYCLSFR